jgi:hypothetical protein
MWEYVQAQLPLLSQKLIPARNVWGYERIKEHPLGAWYDFLSPFRVSRDSGSVVDHELVRLQTGVQPIGWKDSFMGVQVDFHDFPQVLDRYRQLAGHGLKLPQYNNQGAKEFLDSTISGKGPMSPIYYQNGLTDGPDGTKAAWIKNVVSDFRQEAQREVMREAKTKFPQFYDFIHQQQLNAAVQKGPAYILPPGFKVPQQAAPAVGGTPTMAPLQ